MEKKGAMDMCRASLGSTSADTRMCHWWLQEGHPAQIVPVCQRRPTSVGTSGSLSRWSTSLITFYIIGKI